MPDHPPRIAITMGDPNGIGPEIVVKALSSGAVRRRCLPVVVGDATVLQRAAALLGSRARIRTVCGPEEATGESGMVEVLDLAAMEGPVQPGVCSAAGGRAAYAYIERAVRLALAGSVQAIVTGPISKEALHAAGYQYPGHTELLADLTGASDPVMMLVGGPLRVAHVTTHMRFRDVSAQVTKGRVLRVITLAREALRRLAIREPRIGVAALNPHAGEGGLFGDEDDSEVRPAVAEARLTGLNVQGPIPADTLFPRVLADEFDGAVAMYHDQGHIPVKLLSFRLGGAQPTVAGANLTLGLPIIRTSVEHGVAFDIAGRGTASPTSLMDAAALAACMNSPHAE